MAILVQRSAQIDRDLLAVEAAVFEPDFAEGILGRPLGGHRDQAAGGGIAIEHRRRAAQHGDAFQPIGLDEGVIGVVAVAQPVAIEVALALGPEAAQIHERHALAAGIVDGADAGGIGDGIVQVGDAAIVHLLAGHDAERLRHLDHRCVGLGRDRAVAGDIAGGGGGRIIATTPPPRLHHQWVEHRFAGSGAGPGEEGCGAGGADPHGDSAARNQAAQGLFGRHAARDRRRVLARHQGRGIADLPARGADEGVDRGCERLGGDGECPGLGRRGRCRLLRAGAGRHQNRAAEHAGGQQQPGETGDPAPS